MNPGHARRQVTRTARPAERGTRTIVVDGSLVAVAAWVLGIAAIMVFSLQFAGSGEPVEQARLLPLVPPSDRSGPGQRTPSAEVVAAAIARSRRIEEETERGKVVLVNDPAATFSDSKHQCLVGVVRNGSSLTIRKWMATIRFEDQAGKLLYRRVTWSTTPIRAGRSNGYRIRLPLIENAQNANIILHGVEFKR